jgi:hypothetical protein
MALHCFQRLSSTSCPPFIPKGSKRWRENTLQANNQIPKREALINRTLENAFWQHRVIFVQVTSAGYL